MDGLTLRVAIECDNQLAETARCSYERLRQHGHPVRYPAYRRGNLHAAWGPAATAQLAAWWRDPAFWAALPCARWAPRGLARLGLSAGIEYVVLTQRAPALEAVTRRWLAEHELPARRVYCLGGSLTRYARALAALAPDLLVADRPELVALAQAHGIATASLHYPWLAARPPHYVAADWLDLSQVLWRWQLTHRRSSRS